MRAIAECDELCSEVEDCDHRKKGRDKGGVHANSYVAIDAESNDGDKGPKAEGCGHGGFEGWIVSTRKIGMKVEIYIFEARGFDIRYINGAMV